MRMASFLSVLLLTCALCSAQSFEERYRAFQRDAQHQYIDFRDRANAQYAEFLRAAWKFYYQKPAVPKPNEEFIPPVIYEDNEEQREEELKGDEVPQPKPLPTPQPIAPVIENEKQAETARLDFYGTSLTFRFPRSKKIALSHVDGDILASAWEILAGDEYENLLYDCLSARDKQQLCDWAYLQLLQKLSEKKYGRSNEAVLLQAFLYANSGYKMRLATSKNGKLYILVGSQYVLYDRGFYELEDGLFFPVENVSEGLQICNNAFENEQPFSLLISSDQILAQNDVATQPRIAASGLTASCTANRNLINFYNDYPTGQYGEDFGTRWAAYANAPMPGYVKRELYPDLLDGISELSESQAVNKLLNWVQTAFEYQYDDSVWGYDRAFFPAESLYYPYCDCEDRSILFSRIVRDLLKLDVVLLYYPGHLATAVRFNTDVKGDYLIVKGQKYVVCDPTYIGAPVGKTMKDMDNKTAKVIVLN